MKKKTILVSFLAVFMLLAVSLASAGAYTMTPTLNVDVEEEEEQIPTINPASVLCLGKATINVHAEVTVYELGETPFTQSVDVGCVYAVPIFPLMRVVTGNTDSNGRCQLKVRVPLFIPSCYLVIVIADLSGWAGFDYGYEVRGRTFVSDMHAGGSYAAEIDIIIRRFPDNNVAEQKTVSLEAELVSQQSSSFQQFLTSSISGQSSNR